MRPAAEPAMTDTLPTDPTPRHRLFRFLVPVLIAHGLLLAALPFWSDEPPPGRSMDVQLAPITARDASAARREPLPAPTTSVPPAAEPPPAVPRAAPTPAEPAPRKPQEPAIAAARQPAPPAESEPVPETPEPTPAQPAAAGPVAATASEPAPATPESDWRDSYRQDLRAALARHHSYPNRARRFGLSGEVLVGFAIARDGHFDDIHLARSSDAEVLDRAALATVRRLGRFRPLPSGYSEDSWAVEVPLVYRLD